MRILGIDTSTTVASVAIVTSEQVIAEMSLNNKKTHSQKLMQLVELVLTHNDLSLDEIDRIAVGVGPGSFTGLRIGVTTAKGLAHGGKLPLVEISSLAALANNLAIETPICAMMDARRETVFTSFYNAGDSEESQIHIDEVIKRCENLTTVTFVGDGALKHRQYLIDALGDKARFAPVHLNQIQASSLCQLAMEVDQTKTYDDVHVSYLRKSQAEREYDERQADH